MGMKSPSATYLERAQEAFIDTHHGSSIIKLATIIWRAEQRDKLSFGEELVTILDYLVGTADQVHVVLLQEPRDDIGAECEGNTSIVFTPSRDVLVRIGPEQVAEQTAVGDLYPSVYFFNMIRAGSATAW